MINKLLKLSTLTLLLVSAQAAAQDAEIRSEHLLSLIHI